MISNPIISIWIRPTFTISGKILFSSLTVTWVTLGKNSPLSTFANVNTYASNVDAIPNKAISALPATIPRIVGAILNISLCAKAVIVTHPE